MQPRSFYELSSIVIDLSFNPKQTQPSLISAHAHRTTLRAALHTQTHTHIHTHARARTRTPARARAHERTCTRTHTHKTVHTKKKKGSSMYATQNYEHTENKSKKHGHGNISISRYIYISIYIYPLQAIARLRWTCAACVEGRTRAARLVLRYVPMPTQPSSPSQLHPDPTRRLRQALASMRQNRNHAYPNVSKMCLKHATGIFLHTSVQDAVAAFIL